MSLHKNEVFHSVFLRKYGQIRRKLYWKNLEWRTSFVGQCVGWAIDCWSEIICALIIHFWIFPLLLHSFLFPILSCLKLQDLPFLGKEVKLPSVYSDWRQLLSKRISNLLCFKKLQLVNVKNFGVDRKLKGIEILCYLETRLLYK